MCRRDSNRNLCQVNGRHLLKWNIVKITTGIYVKLQLYAESGIYATGS